MLRLPLGISFDFLGTVARFRDGASVGALYQDFTKFLSPINERSTPLTEAMSEAIRVLPASTIDETFKQTFREAAHECFNNKQDGLKLFVPHEDKHINIRLPGGTTHEETEEFWLHVVRNTYAHAIDIEKDRALLGGVGGDHFHHPEELAKAILEDECFVEDFFYPLYEHLGTANAYECPPEVTDTLDWLQSLRCAEDGHGMKFVMVSNFDGRLHDIVRGLNLDKYFDHVLSIHETKCLKPDGAGLRMGVYERAIFGILDSPSFTASNPTLELFKRKYVTDRAKIISTNSNLAAHQQTKSDQTKAMLSSFMRFSDYNRYANSSRSNVSASDSLVTSEKFWVHVGDSKADEGAAEKVPCLFCPVNPPPSAYSNSPLSEPAFPKSDDEEEVEVIPREMIDMTLMKNFMIANFGTDEYLSGLLNSGEYVKALPEVPMKLGEGEKKKADDEKTEEKKQREEITPPTVEMRK